MSAIPPPAPGNAPVPFAIRFGWGLGSLGVAILFNAYSALLLFYLTNIVGMKLEVAGMLMFIAKMYDVVTDLPMGILSDRTRSRWGRRRPYLLLGALLCAASFAMMFNVPATGTDTAAFVLGSLLLYATGYTVFNVPYLAMPAEMSTSYHERTAIMSFRVVFIQIGNFLAVGLGPRIANAFGGGLDGYAAVGWIFSAVVLVSMVGSFIGTARARRVEKSTVKYPLREQFASALANRPFLLLAAFKFLTLLSGATVFSSLLFFVKNVLRLDAGVMTFYTAAYGLAALITVPLFWVKLSRRIGKHRALMFATLGFLVVALSWLLAEPGESAALFTLRAFLLGTFAAGKLLLGMTLLPDVTEYDALRTGLRREGLYAGSYSFVEKSAFALSPLVMTVILGLAGYQESVNDAFVEQSERALMGIYLNIAIVPAICNLIAALVLTRYDLTEERLRALRAAAAATADGPGPARS
ncbi:MAG: MFS transporter [Gammaproteobacteria bacterium]|nr:MFS transporter [Gammaproteobacteria bacterium]